MYEQEKLEIERKHELEELRKRLGTTTNTENTPSPGTTTNIARAVGTPGTPMTETEIRERINRLGENNARFRKNTADGELIKLKISSTNQILYGTRAPPTVVWGYTNQGGGTRKHKKRIGAASKHHKKRRRGTKKHSKKRRATRRKRR